MTDIGTLYAQGQTDSEEQRWQRLLQGEQPLPPTPGPPPAPTSPPTGSPVTGAIKAAGKQVVGAAETATSFVGMGFEFLNPLPGLAGIVATIKGGPEEGTRVIRSIQEALHPYLVYQPQTEAGKAGIGVIHQAFELLGKAAQATGGAVQTGVTAIAGEETGAQAGATVQSLVELSPVLLAPGLAKVKAKLTAGKPLTGVERAAVEKNIAAVGEELSKGPKVSPEVEAAARKAAPGEPPSPSIGKITEAEARVAREPVGQPDIPSEEFVPSPEAPTARPPSGEPVAEIDILQRIQQIRRTTEDISTTMEHGKVLIRDPETNEVIGAMRGGGKTLDLVAEIFDEVSAVKNVPPGKLVEAIIKDKENPTYQRLKRAVVDQLREEKGTVGGEPPTVEIPPAEPPAGGPPGELPPPAPAGPPPPPLITITPVPFEQVKSFKKANPESFTIGSKGVTVNWAAVDNPLAIGEIVDKTTKLHREGIVEAKRGVLSDKAVSELADRLGLTTDDLLSRHPGADLTTEKTMAYMDLLNSSSESVLHWAEAMKKGMGDAENSFLRAFTAHLGVDSQARGVGSEAGRTLRIMQKASDESIHLRSVIGEIGQIVKPGEDVPLQVTPQRLAEMILSRGKAEAPGFLKKFSILDSVVEAFYGFILKPTTIMKNIVGDTVATLNGVLERRIAETRFVRWIGGIKYEGLNHVVPGEAAAMLGRGEAAEIVSFQTMLFDSLRAAGETLKTGETRHTGSIFETQPSRGRGVIRAETYGITDPLLAPIVDTTGTILRAVPRGIMTVDEFYGGLNYSMNRPAVALRQATLEGRTGQALSDRVAHLLEEMPAPLEQEAQLYGRTQTFSKDFEGRMASLQQGMTHPLTKLTIFPFFRFVARNMEYVLERIPGPNMILDPYREAIRAGGASREIATAKAINGMAQLSLYMTAAYVGYLTGTGPRNPEQRKNLRDFTGWQPTSILVNVPGVTPGWQYISIAGMEPLTSQMTIAADIVNNYPKMQEDDYLSLIALTALAIGQGSFNKSYTQAVSTWLDVHSSGDPNQASTFLRRQVASYLVPGIVRDIERLMDPSMKEVNSFRDEVFSRIPGLSGKLYYHRDFWGEPVISEGAWGPDLVSPFFTSTLKNDPTSNEMARLALLGAQSPAPPKTIGGPQEQTIFTGEKKTLPGVELTPEEYDRFVVLARKEPIGPGGRTLHEELTRLFNSPAYTRASDGPRGGKVAVRDATIRLYDEGAILRLRKEFSRVDDAIRARERLRIEERLPSLSVQ